jgi:parvulin-like peptidyl-prolyl isomerase
VSERVWLALGVVGGLALTAASLLAPGPAALPRGAAATVDGAVIGEDALARAVAAVRERRGPEPALREQVLARMIDEELLVQRGLELGLPARDPALRAALSRAVIDLVVAEAELAATAVDDAALRRFYADNRDYFAPPPRLRVRAGAFATEAAAAGARAGAGPDAGERLVDAPDALLPAPALARALGSRAAAAAERLAVGEVSAPIARGDRWLLVRLEQRALTAAPGLDAVRAEVEAELRRRAGERALHAFLAERRAAARIRRAEATR